MLVKIKIDGYMHVEVPTYSVNIDEETKQEWLNKFSAWVKDCQDELTLPEYDDKQVFIEELDIIVVD